MRDLQDDELSGPVVERPQTVSVGCGKDEGDGVGRFLDDCSTCRRRVRALMAVPAESIVRVILSCTVCTRPTLAGLLWWNEVR